MERFGFFATDVKGRFVIASKAAANYYGMDQKELMDHHLLSTFSTVHDDYLQNQFSRKRDRLFTERMGPLPVSRE